MGVSTTVAAGQGSVGSTVSGGSVSGWKVNDLAIYSKLSQPFPVKIVDEKKDIKGETIYTVRFHPKASQDDDFRISGVKATELSNKNAAILQWGKLTALFSTSPKPATGAPAGQPNLPANSSSGKYQYATTKGSYKVGDIVFHEDHGFCVKITKISGANYDFTVPNLPNLPVNMGGDP